MNPPTCLCLGDEDTVRGFQCAGVPGEVVESPAAARDAMSRWGHGPGVGLILVTDKIACWIRADLDQLRLTRLHPLIVEIPGPANPGVDAPAPSDLRRQVQEATGFALDWREPIL